MVPPHDAVQRLLDGNRRWIEGVNPVDAPVRQAPVDRPGSGQQPYAIILGCSDSRVPPELIFDCMQGELFVIRVAGNVVGPTGIESVAFAASHLDVRLAVVLGHTRCAAVRAALADVRRAEGDPETPIPAIVERIRPAVEELIDADPDGDAADVERHAVRANVRAAADRLRHGTEPLESLVREGRLVVAGAEYALETGVVEFFDGIEARPAV